MDDCKECFGNKTVSEEVVTYCISCTTMKDKSTHCHRCKGSGKIILIKERICRSCYGLGYKNNRYR